MTMIGLIIAGGFVAIILALLVMDKYSNYKWFCDVLDWHKKPKIISYDGINLFGICPRCGRRVAQDSNGDWFDCENRFD